MGGVCEHPGCARRAAAAVAIDPRHATVWIGDLDGSVTGLNVLCADHADDLVVPVGWQRRDVRETPRLFAVPSIASTPARPRRGRRSRPGTDPVRTERLTPDHRSATAGPPATTTESAPTEHSLTPNPALTELHRRSTALSPDTAALLEVGGDSPLLARAFRAGRAAG